MVASPAAWPIPSRLRIVRALRESCMRRFASDDDRGNIDHFGRRKTLGQLHGCRPPFLEALYRLLEHDSEIETTTFSDYLEGRSSRLIDPHPVDEHERLHELYAGSWIDELGSRSGVDLGTWIGEPEENIAWELLGEARDALAHSGATPESNPAALIRSG
jgi:alpha-amylase/alpha-mannosidase (GH57 family)